MGVNNRNLKTLEVTLETALALAAGIPDEVVAVAESGIRSGADLRRLRDAGYDAFLVGEHLMAAPDPARPRARKTADRAEAAVKRTCFVKICGITSSGGRAPGRGGGRGRGRLRVLAEEPAARRPRAAARRIGDALPSARACAWACSWTRRATSSCARPRKPASTCCSSTATSRRRRSRACRGAR